MSKRLILLALLCIALAYALALLHSRPKAYEIPAPSGDAITVERLYEDSLFGPPRERVQLRNRHNAVIAHSSTAMYTSTYCPSISFCWVYPNDTWSLFPAGETLNLSAIDWERKDAALDALEPTGPAVNFAPYGPSALLSPFILLFAHLRMLAIFLLLAAAHAAFMFAFGRWTSMAQPKRIRIYCNTAKALLLLGITAAYALVLLVMSIGQVPLLHTVLAMVMGIVLAWKAKRRWLPASESKL